MLWENAHKFELLRKLGRTLYHSSGYKLSINIELSYPYWEFNQVCVSEQIFYHLSNVLFKHFFLSWWPFFNFFNAQINLGFLIDAQFCTEIFNQHSKQACLPF